MKLLSNEDILAIADYASDFRVRKVSSSTYNGINGKKKELEIFLKSDKPITKKVFVNKNGVLARGEGLDFLIKVPIFDGELKYFYATYKDYYYIPSEDYALHRTIAEAIPSSAKVKASASNCYTRKTSSYLPMWDVIAEPFYKKEYKSDDLYFEITDEIKRDQKFFKVYSEHILNMLIK